MVDMPYDDPEPVASRPQLDAKIAEVERDCHVDVALFGTLPPITSRGCFKGRKLEGAHAAFDQTGSSLHAVLVVERAEQRHINVLA